MSSTGGGIWRARLASQVRQKYNTKVGRLPDTATAGTAPGLILFSVKYIQENQFVWELLASLVHRDKETFFNDSGLQAWALIFSEAKPRFQSEFFGWNPERFVIGEKTISRIYPGGCASLCDPVTNTGSR